MINNKARRGIRIISILLLDLALAFSTNAFTGNGGGIEATFSIGSIGKPASSSGITSEAINSMIPVGQYFGLYSGYFGLLGEPSQSIAENITSINVTIVYPVNNSGNKDSNVTFIINTAANAPIKNCTLLVDDLPYLNVQSPAAGNLNFAAIVSTGKHNWESVCTDLSGNTFRSAARSITILNANNFDDMTTNFNLTDISNITNLTIAKAGAGEIIFGGTTDLSMGADLNNNIFIGHRSIALNSNALSMLNKSATLKMYNPGLYHPVILKDGNYCTECTILNYGTDLTFTVSHFTNYSAVENSQLLVWDDTDLSQRHAFEQIMFYANYSNLTNRESISGANIACNISFDTENYPMDYNASAGIYTYNRSFVGSGIYTFNVNCSDSGNMFTEISLSDSAVIIGATIPGASNISVISSERANITDQPGGINVGGGNVTQINVSAKTITPSWQGFYGNISGKITLENTNGSVLYDWMSLSPKGEVYATRSPSIDFASVNCTTSTGIASEESFIGHNAADGDSVTNTFNKTTHPRFDVGLVQIESNKCRATNIYENGASQDTAFSEVLLSDGASNIIYTAIINSSSIGFDGRPYDFQMLVGENGHGNEEITPYYFFIDLT